jgi:hypothetical protein
MKVSDERSDAYDENNALMYRVSWCRISTTGNVNRPVNANSCVILFYYDHRIFADVHQSGFVSACPSQLLKNRNATEQLKINKP